MAFWVGLKEISAFFGTQTLDSNKYNTPLQKQGFQSLAAVCGVLCILRTKQAVTTNPKHVQSGFCHKEKGPHKLNSSCPAPIYLAFMAPPPPGCCFNFHFGSVCVGGGGGAPPSPLARTHVRIRVLGTFFRLGQFFYPAPSAHLEEGLVIPLISFLPCFAGIMSQCPISTFSGTPVQLCPRAKCDDVRTTILFFRFKT